MAEQSAAGSTDASDDASTNDQTKSNDDDTGGAGDKRAILADLAKERDKRQELEKRLQTYQEAQKTEHEKALDNAVNQAKEQTRSEVLTKANERVLRSEMKAAASGKLIDPSDAARFIDLSKFSVNEDGDVDDKAVSDAIDDLLKQKPHLGVSQKKQTGDWGGGARGTSSKSTDMNDLIRERMRR